jgi:hypothetical protein
MHSTLVGSRSAIRTVTGAASTLAAVVLACPQTRPGTDAGFASAAVVVPALLLPPQPAASAQHSSSGTIADRPTAYPSPFAFASAFPPASASAASGRGRSSLLPGISSPAVSGLNAERVALSISASLTFWG